MVETGNQIVNGRLMVDASYWNSLWLVKGTGTLFGWLMAAAPYTPMYYLYVQYIH